MVSRLLTKFAITKRNVFKMNITSSIIKGQSTGPIFRTEALTLFLPWIHLRHTDLISHENSALVFYFSTHTVTINASAEFLGYALSLCGRGELAEVISHQEITITIEEKTE